ncbi:MerR family transcriptional regulator [Clavibacter tessellarius]|uniref:MerR family transcriptional regulator n=1 Tax=Clavibacter tessellarius TaxID=31965 RepID=UPI0039BF4A2D
MLRIGDVAGRAGVSTRALRYYEEQGLLPAERTTSGQRVYPEAAVERVQLIQQLFAAGLPSRTIRQLLPSVDSGVAAPESLALLRSERDRITAAIAESRARPRGASPASSTSASTRRPSTARRSARAGRRTRGSSRPDGGGAIPAPRVMAERSPCVRRRGDPVPGSAPLPCAARRAAVSWLAAIEVLVAEATTTEAEMIDAVTSSSRLDEERRGSVASASGAHPPEVDTIPTRVDDGRRRYRHDDGAEEPEPERTREAHPGR